MNMNTFSKIRRLYKDVPVDRRTGDEAKGQTIAILAAGGLNSAMCYTGSSGYTMVDGMMCIHPNTNKNTYLVVYVDYRDEYNVDLVHIRRDNAVLVTHCPGVFVGDLKEVFERVYDDYIDDYQDGFVTYRF